MKKKRILAAGGLVTSLLFVGVSSTAYAQQKSGVPANANGSAFTRSRDEGPHKGLAHALGAALHNVAEEFSIQAGDFRNQLRSNPDVRAALSKQGLSDAQIQKIIDKAPRGEQWEKGDRGMKMGKKLAGGIHGKGFAHGKGMGFGIADADLAEARAAALGTTVADLKQDFADGKKFSDILDEANLTPAQYHEHLIDELEDLVNKNGIDAKKKQFYTNMIKRLKAKQS